MLKLSQIFLIFLLSFSFSFVSNASASTYASQIKELKIYKSIKAKTWDQLSQEEKAYLAKMGVNNPSTLEKWKIAKEQSLVDFKAKRMAWRQNHQNKGNGAGLAADLEDKGKQERLDVMVDDRAQDCRKEFLAWVKNHTPAHDEVRTPYRSAPAPGTSPTSLRGPASAKE